MFSGFGSEPMYPSHSSVTTKVTRISLGLLDASNLQRFIMGLMCPRPGNGIATTWLKFVGSSPPELCIADGLAGLRRLTGE